MQYHHNPTPNLNENQISTHLHDILCVMVENKTPNIHNVYGSYLFSYISWNFKSWENKSLKVYQSYTNKQSNKFYGQIPNTYTYTYMCVHLKVLCNSQWPFAYTINAIRKKKQNNKIIQE